MKVALLHNSRPPAAGHLPDDAFEEYDTPETIRAVATALKGLRVEVEPLEADRHLPQRLESGGHEFVFNMAEGRGRRCREAIPAAVCELLEIPFTGSDMLTLAVALDKAAARRLVSPDVPVARAVLVEGEPDERQLASLTYLRVDVRLDVDGVPRVIDVNANPELSPEVGMHRAVTEAGWTWERFVRLQIQWAR